MSKSKTTASNSKINHVVVMMFENRSFDNMLGFLYADKKNKSPLGQPFEGLTGEETNPDSNGKAVKVFPIKKTNPRAYFMPGKDPGEGFANTNFQLFGAANPPYPKGIAPNQGFVRDFANPVNNAPLEKQEDPSLYTNKPATSQDKKPANNYQKPYYKSWYKSKPPSGGANYVPVLPKTAVSDIMGSYTPELLPVLSGLAKGFAVCDHWYCSVPTETLPNRAFAAMATSEGYLYDEVKSYAAKSIFKQLTDHKLTFGIYGNNGNPYTLPFCQDLPKTAPAGCQYGSFKDFQSALKKKQLPTFTFLEPTWGHSGNSQHPNYDVALGEAYLLQIYQSIRNSSYWEDTLLIITYDEHGGCYDHVTPPTNAVSPPAKSTAFGFDFTRFGVRVPTVLISPWIKAGTVYRTKSKTPLDHTSVLATLEKLFGFPPLTNRDKAAPDVLDVLTLSTARADDPLKGVVAPKSNSSVKIPDHASQIQTMHAHALADLQSRESGKPVKYPKFKTEKAANDYIKKWHDHYYKSK